MPKFTFVGDPLDQYSGPNRIVVAGEEFIKNKAKDVEEDAAIVKLRRNTHFVEGDVNLEDLGADVDGDEDPEDLDNITNDQLRLMLDARGKADEYKSNTSRKDLIAMVRASGGLS